MRKTLYTLNVDGYAPEIAALTYPLLKHYARKIGAEFFVIDERRFPGWPVAYEKLQIREIAAERGDGWSVFYDSDALVHPETPDWTTFLPFNTVAHNAHDFAPLRWSYDDFFRRDGRNIGSCNWCAIASELCRDLWTPLDMTLEDALARIYPTVEEIVPIERDADGNGVRGDDGAWKLLPQVIDPAHLLDDFTLSRNIARFGLKYQDLMEIQKTLGLERANFHWHAYTVTTGEKVKLLKAVLDDWRMGPYFARVT